MAFSSKRRVNSSLAVCSMEPMVMTRVCVCVHTCTRAHVNVGEKLCVLIKPERLKDKAGAESREGESQQAETGEYDQELCTFKM